MEGWIKLHRCLLDKAVWQLNDAQRIVFFTILLLANHEGKQWLWMGTQFNADPGQFVTSLPKLAKTARVSVQSVRTALDNLKKLDFLTYQSTDSGRLITVNNWAVYQRKENKSTGISTDEQQPVNSLSTATKKGKNVEFLYSQKFEEFYAAYPKHDGPAEAKKAWKKIDPSEYEAVINGAKIYAASVAGKEKQYIKGSAAWLNARRWEAEIEIQKPLRTVLE